MEFFTLSETKFVVCTHKGDHEHPHLCHMGVPPPSRGIRSVIRLDGPDDMHPCSDFYVSYVLLIGGIVSETL